MDSLRCLSFLIQRDNSSRPLLAGFESRNSKAVLWAVCRCVIVFFPVLYCLLRSISMFTEPMLMPDSAADLSCQADADYENCGTEASATPSGLHDPLHDVGGYILTNDGSIPCPDAPPPSALPVGTMQAVRRALRYAMRFCCIPSLCPSLSIPLCSNMRVGKPASVSRASLEIL